MNTNHPIGGFFELELPYEGSGFHPDSLALTTSRACMKWILQHEKPSLVYVPFYTCQALYQPMIEMAIPYEFYAINSSLEPESLPDPRDGELIVVINYFGIMGDYIGGLIKNHGREIIVDNTHQFFHHGYEGRYSFTSARKYFGVPDGAYLYGADRESGPYEPNSAVSIEHSLKRLMGKQEEAFHDYQAYEASLGCDLKGISKISEKLLAGVDYESVSRARIANFNYLHEQLMKYNQLSVDHTEYEVPFCYPLFPTAQIDKDYFYKQKVFIPTLWPNVCSHDLQTFSWEKGFSKRLLPLPIDHRYGKVDMQSMIDLILERIT